jgi:hypothetical protein
LLLATTDAATASPLAINVAKASPLDRLQRLVTSSSPRYAEDEDLGPQQQTRHSMGGASSGTSPSWRGSPRWSGSGGPHAAASPPRHASIQMRRGMLTPVAPPPPKPPVPLHTASVVEVTPVPDGLGENELMHVMLPFAPTDVHIVARSAFVSVPNRTNALSMVAAFDGRTLMGTAVRCSIVGDEL